MLLLHIIVENYYMTYLSEKREIIFKNTYSWVIIKWISKSNIIAIFKKKKKINKFVRI